MALSAQQNQILATISSQMEHFKEVATITKENEHYQPYVISVFYGNELEKLGIANLKEALTLVPGLDIATDNINNQTPIFRGSNPLAYGQSKLLIDGTLVNNVFFDAYSEYLAMPIEMIKRIEVVRGPGSKTDGINAYAGSISVITYGEQFKGFESRDKAVAKAGSHAYKMGGFAKTFRDGEFSLFTDVYYQQDDKTLPAGPDGLSQGVLSIPGIVDNTHLSQEGNAPVWLNEYALGLKMQYRAFSLTARALEHTRGSAYGINLSLPRDSDRVKLPSRYLELGYDRAFHTFALSIKAGIKQDEFDSKARLTPDGWSYIDFYRLVNDPDFSWSDPLTDFPYGGVGEHKARQQTLYHSTFLKYRGIEKHNITLGYRLFKEETLQVISKLTDWGLGNVVTDYTQSFPFFDTEAVRHTHIFSFQDEWHLSNAFSLMYGFNYEQTSLKDAGFEPRISMVYQPDARNIVKLIHSRSHRNASWQEMYTMNNNSRRGSTELAPERVEAYEAAYVRKFTSDSYLQTNLFYLRNKDQIHNSALDPLYRNEVDTDIYGLEFEYRSNLLPNDQFYVNYSFVQGHDSAGNPLANVARHMAKGYYTYDIFEAFSLSGVVKYIGPKPRVEGDMRDEVEGYTTADMTLRYSRPANGWSATFAMKNLFDADIRYPSVPNSYSEDYRQEGQNFLFTLVKEF